MDEYAGVSNEQGRKPQKQTNPTNNTDGGEQIFVNIKAIPSPKQSTMAAAPT